MLLRWMVVAAVFATVTPAAQAQLFSTRVASGFSFSSPVFGTVAPGEPNNMYVVQQTGAIRVFNVNTGVVNPTVFLDLPSVPGVSFTTSSEQGLLGLAFDPNYATNGRFYVNYTQSDGTLTVDRFTVSGGIPGSRQNIIQIPHPTNTNHNAGWTAFGPDGFLYVATGDGGSGNDPPNNAQNQNVLLGKMLRLDVSGAGAGYAIPPSNPFVGQSGKRGEIWAYGLRNPWRNSFDAAGNLYIGDVGQGAREEIDFQAAGAAGGQNYGWRAREGKIHTPGISDSDPTPRVDPFYDYAHSPTSDPLTGAAIIGGYVYRGHDILDGGISLDGTYFFADEVRDRIWSLRYSGTGSLTGADVTVRTSELLNAVNGGTIGAPSSFAEDSFGRLYIIDLNGGIYRIGGAAVPEPATWALIGCAVAGFGTYQWRKRRRLSNA